MRSQLHAGFGAFGITCGANKPVGSGGNGGAATACAPSSAALTHLAPSHSMDTLTAQVKRAIFDEPTLHSAARNAAHRAHAQIDLSLCQ